MLDDEQGVSRVAEPMQDADETVDVARVEADAGFVEDVKRVDEGGAERGGQIDALDFAAAEGAGLAVEREVAEADIDEIAEARADFGEQEIIGFIERGGQFEVVEELETAVDGQQHDIVDVLVIDAPQERIRFQSRAAAGFAGDIRAVLREQDADVHLVALRLQPIEEPLHAVPDLVFPRAYAVDHPFALPVRKFTPGNVCWDAVLAREPHQIVLAFLVAFGLPRFDGTGSERLRVVRNHEIVVNANGAAESATCLACADGGIE